MKKDIIFTPIMLMVGILLFLLKATGMTSHIIISVAGFLVLVAYTVLTKKEACECSPLLTLHPNPSFSLSDIYRSVPRSCFIHLKEKLPSKALVHSHLF